VRLFAFRKHHVRSASARDETARAAPVEAWYVRAGTAPEAGGAGGQAAWLSTRLGHSRAPEVGWMKRNRYYDVNRMQGRVLLHYSM
jgi:hypothetical protein